MRRRKNSRKIPKNRWSSYFAQFTHGNRGRPIRINRFEGGAKKRPWRKNCLSCLRIYDPHHDGLLSIAGDGAHRV